MLSSVDDVHDGVAFQVAERVVPQAVVVIRHGIAFGAHGVVAVSHQADRDPGSLGAELTAVTVQGVEQRPEFIALRFRGHKRAAVAERVKLPDTAVVVCAEAVHPREDSRLKHYPLRNAAEVLWPEADALLVLYEGGGQRWRRTGWLWR